MTQSPLTRKSSNSIMNTPVQVALRIRPLTQQDRAQPRFSHSTDSDVIKAYDKSVAIPSQQKTFQFDHVFDTSTTQEHIFNTAASSLVDRFIDGYNVTILAYGQTSSGKTYTMGTASKNTNLDEEGIIPRAISALFQRLQDIKKDASSTTTTTTTPTAPKRTPTTFPSSGLRLPRKSTSAVKLRPVSMAPLPRRGSSSPLSPSNDKSTRYTLHVSFIEIYNEELIDLLNPAPPGERAPVTIREDTKGQIIWTGLKEVPVSNTEEILKYLQMGSENRATGSTDMNAQSSRSHAIFSVTLKQEKWIPPKKENTAPKIGSVQRQNTLNVKALIGQMEKQAKSTATEDEGEWTTTSSKFHFVDLAGSERLKRTAAQGDRRKEGININAGLLALGNVISALSDPHKKSNHIPYRDSKLTRLLQDSLGGNSNTLMIACVSPAESNLIETANTIKYANRTRNIRNKLERNETEEWMTTDNLDQLRSMIAKLKAEMKLLKSSPSYRGTPSPLQSSICSSPRPHTTNFVNGIPSPSSSLSDSETTSSNFTSISATSSSDLLESVSNDVAILVADLKRQIEELQNEVSVIRERNMLVEKELSESISASQSPTSEQEFQHIIEPVIKEYEKSVSSLESQLAMARAALAHSDQALTEQQTKITAYETLQASETNALEDLKLQLTEAINREQVSENYCLELEAQLKLVIQESRQEQHILNELRNKIIMFKEMDDSTEQYIADLESRLTNSENERIELTEKLKATVHSVNNDDEKELIQQQLVQWQTKYEGLKNELDLLSKEKNSQMDNQKERAVDDETRVLAPEGTVALDDETPLEVDQSVEGPSPSIITVDNQSTKRHSVESIHQSTQCDQIENHINSTWSTEIEIIHQSTQYDRSEPIDQYTQCDSTEKEVIITQAVERSVHDQSTQSDFIDLNSIKVNELTLLIAQKESNVKTLESRLHEIEIMNIEFSNLRDHHHSEINRLENTLNQLKDECSQYQAELEQERLQKTSLKSSVDELSLLTKAQSSELNQKSTDYIRLQGLLDQQETKAQIKYDSQLVELEKLQKELTALYYVEEKQDIIIQSLEAKFEDMDQLVLSLQHQLKERNQTVEQLEADLEAQTQLTKKSTQQMEVLLKEVCGMSMEKKHLRQLMQFVEGTLRLQEAKSDKTIESLEDLRHQCKIREDEIEEKRRTVLMLSSEKQELSLSLSQIAHRASLGDETIKSLENKLDETRLSLNEKSELLLKLQQQQMQADIELQRAHALEARLIELEQQIVIYEQEKVQKESELESIQTAMQKNLQQNQSLADKITELENKIQVERNTGSVNAELIIELQKTISQLQEVKKREDDVWKAQLETSKEEIYMTKKQGEKNRAHVQQLEASIELMKIELSKKNSIPHVEEPRTLDPKEIVRENSSSSSLNDLRHSMVYDSPQELIEKIILLQEDNAQLLKHNDDLETQLVLQRGQLTLETKNLELEIMKLSAANDRLEKEMEQVIPRNGAAGNRESVMFTSPPQTPRVSSPLPATSLSTSHIHHYKLQRDLSNSNYVRLSKSSSYRSVNNPMVDGIHHIDDEASKRLSTMSIKSDISMRPPSSIRSNRQPTPNAALPPPSAPPSNPLPPLPVPLPPPPPATSSTSSGSPSSPVSPLLLAYGGTLQRQDSIVSTSFSDVMNASTTSTVTGDQYDKLIRSLQRKAHVAENDVKAHQDVISKLETQLSRSESSVRDIKKQLDSLSREKQAYNLEIQNLRSQVLQIQGQQRNLSDEAVHERRHLEEELEAQKVLKEKAEKARRILENRMEELMNKKSKFMCF
ncbi:hypothetical protein BDB01DRAFT_835187 [Pilobolus umbonatus]|nr:hypothetical protein BDB01DRAFT_835187 [Pilobolus umbonatus]